MDLESGGWQPDRDSALPGLPTEGHSASRRRTRLPDGPGPGGAGHLSFGGRRSSCAARPSPWYQQGSCRRGRGSFSRPGGPARRGRRPGGVPARARRCRKPRGVRPPSADGPNSDRPRARPMRAEAPGKDVAVRRFGRRRRGAHGVRPLGKQRGGMEAEMRTVRNGTLVRCRSPCLDRGKGGRRERGAYPNSGGLHKAPGREEEHLRANSVVLDPPGSMRCVLRLRGAHEK